MAVDNGETYYLDHKGRLISTFSTFLDTLGTSTEEIEDMINTHYMMTGKRPDKILIPRLAFDGIPFEVSDVDSIRVVGESDE